MEAVAGCDTNVVTFCLTAPVVCRSGKGTVFYCVQPYEPSFFQNSRDVLVTRETYHLSLKKIVTSAWLEGLVYLYDRGEGDGPGGYWSETGNVLPKSGA
jgi:hypothetical protein